MKDWLIAIGMFLFCIGSAWMYIYLNLETDKNLTCCIQKDKCFPYVLPAGAPWPNYVKSIIKGKRYVHMMECKEDK